MGKRNLLTVEIILEQLEDLYKLALSQDNINLAVKIKEIQGRSLGLFSPPQAFSISTLSETHLKDLIKQIEQSVKSYNT